jgi:hypothetical protein
LSTSDSRQDFLDGNLRSLLSGRMAAHAVGHDKHAQAFIATPGVFVL